MEHKHSDNHHGNHSHHIVPLKVYFLTLAALVVLTVVTVGASYFDFGKFNIVVSLAIAFTKAGLVMAFFMGLKWDTNLNRAFILSSFFALFLLIFFAASDLWTRAKPIPVAVTSSGAISKDDFEKLQASSPELIAKGKEVYNVNCAVCHGLEGKGDGVGGAALNPKPRNFHAPAGEWKNGKSFKSVYVTLAYGIPNSGMASYKALSPEDRATLSHYVLSFSAADASGKADDRFAKAVEEDGIGGSGGGAAKTVMPIDFTMEQMTK